VTVPLDKLCVQINDTIQHSQTNHLSMKYKCNDVLFDTIATR